VWSDVFRSAALGRSSPALEIDGGNLSGELTYRSLSEAINSRLQKRSGAIP